MMKAGKVKPADSIAHGQKFKFPKSLAKNSAGPKLKAHKKG